MTPWPAKDPLEVLDYSWTVPLDDGDTIASHTATVSTGTVVKDSSTVSGSNVQVWLSGGTDGEIATIALTATTTGGRTFRAIGILPVFDRASDLLTLFRLRFPAFATTDDGTIGFWLAQSAGEVGETWGDDQDGGRLLLAAHKMAVATAAIPAGVTSFKSGTFSATMSDAAASRTGYAASIYGREFADLMRRNFGGPISAWVPPAAIDV